MKAAPNHNFKNLSGQQFAFLKVIERAENNPRGNAQWLCECECGKQKIVRTDHLTSARIKSCGCKVAELVSKAVRKPMNTLGIYNGMKERVLYPCTPSFSHYQQRGIRICKGWLTSYENFLKDMGERPCGMMIDRKDFKGNYSCGHCEECRKNGWPANCKWSTAKEQARNRSNNVMLEFQGERRCLSEWAEIVGMNPHTLMARIKAGWLPVEALSEPVRKA